MIAIDDNQLHLDGLVKGLNDSGVACLPVHFTGDTSTIAKCPHARVVFADLHLNESGAPSDHVKDFAIIGSLIEQTFAPTGPYLIVLWTRFPSQAEELRKFLEERLAGPKPFRVVSLDKNEHLERERVKDPAKLIEAIRAAVQAEPQIAALLNWEDRVLGASADTLRAVIDLAIGGVSPDQRGRALGRLLFRLALEAVGKGRVESGRFRAVNEALLPILADRIASLRSDGSEQLWDAALKGQAAEPPLNSAEAAQLNRFLHVAGTDGVLGADRGAVVVLPDAWAGDNFEKRFGYAEVAVASTEFWCDDFVLGDAQFKWCLVQIQAVCDFAQQQLGPLPFILALDLPVASMRSGTPSPALIRCPVFEVDGEPRALNLNARFRADLTLAEASAATVRYRLRESLLTEIVHSASNHNTRPGIISFRGVDPKPAKKAPAATIVKA